MKIILINTNGEISHMFDEQLMKRETVRNTRDLKAIEVQNFKDRMAFFNSKYNYETNNPSLVPGTEQQFLEIKTKVKSCLQ